MSNHNFIYSPALFFSMSDQAMNLADIDREANKARELYEFRKITLKELRQILDRLDTDAAIIEHNL